MTRDGRVVLPPIKALSGPKEEVHAPASYVYTSFRARRGFKPVRPHMDNKDKTRDGRVMLPPIKAPSGPKEEVHAPASYVH